jgi:hypothetical protein
MPPLQSGKATLTKWRGHSYQAEEESTDEEEAAAAVVPQQTAKQYVLWPC